MTTSCIPHHAFTADKRSGSVLPDGDRLLLLRLWAWSDHRVRREAEAREYGVDGPVPAFACPTHETLAGALTCSERTTYGRIARLTEAGWIRRAWGVVNGRVCLGWELAEDERFERADTDEPVKLPQVLVLQGAEGRSLSNDGSHDDDQSTCANVVELRVERRKQVEAEVYAVLAEVGPPGASSTAGPSYISPAVERVLDSSATIDDVRAVLVEYKRRKHAGDSGLTNNPMSLFWAGKTWARTQRSFLTRAPVGDTVRRRGSNASLAGVGDLWVRRTESADIPRPTAEAEAMDGDDVEAVIGLGRLA